MDYQKIKSSNKDLGCIFNQIIQDGDGKTTSIIKHIFHYKTYWKTKVCILLEDRGLHSIGRQRYAFYWKTKVCILLEDKGMHSIGRQRYAFYWKTKVCILLEDRGMHSIGRQRYAFSYYPNYNDVLKLVIDLEYVDVDFKITRNTV